MRNYRPSFPELETFTIISRKKKIHIPSTAFECSVFQFISYNFHLWR